MDELRDLACRKLSMPAMVLMKDEYRVQAALAEGTAQLGAARAYQNERLDIWETLCAGGTPSLEQRAGVALMTIHAVQSAVRVAELACEAAGTSAIFASGRFERRRRDLATIAAHLDVLMPRGDATSSGPRQPPTSDAIAASTMTLASIFRRYPARTAALAACRTFCT